MSDISFVLIHQTEIIVGDVGLLHIKRLNGLKSGYKIHHAVPILIVI